MLSSSESVSSASDYKSCIQMSSILPCIKRVSSHLKTIQQKLLLENQESIDLYPQKLTFADKTSSINVFKSNPLSIKGVNTTGCLVEPKIKKDKTLGEQEVFPEVCKLVTRLQSDRQDTLESLADVLSQVKVINHNLDKQCRRRLELLPFAVQSEHGELLFDLIELRWHVNFDRRHLSIVEEDLLYSRSKNEKFKGVVTQFKNGFPLVEEKLIIENNNMSDIKRNQQTTLDQLNQAKNVLSQTIDRASKAHKQTERERSEMRRVLYKSRESLSSLNIKMKEVKDQALSIVCQQKSCQATILNNEKKMACLEEKTKTTRSYLSQIETRICLLRKSASHMDKVLFSHQQKLKQLEQMKKQEFERLEAENELLLAEMQKEGHSLRAARDSNEDSQHSIDIHNESIAACFKQTEDDEKSVDRARRELVKLDEQMGVSVAQFSKVCEKHADLSDLLRTEEAKAGNIEHTLRTKLDALQQQIKDEERTKSTYDGKVQACSGELERIMAECKHKIEKAEQLAFQSQKHSKKQTDTVSKLEEIRNTNLQLSKSVKSELCDLTQEGSKVLEQLTQRITVLVPQDQQLSVEIQEKVIQIENFSERISALQSKLEDTVRSTSMLNKMEISTQGTVDHLLSQLSVIKERLLIEKEEEHRCREEYLQMSEFAANSSKKHSDYVIERNRLLEECKVNLLKAHLGNSKTAEEHSKLQHEFISRKTIGLKVVERKLEIEESLRDHKQLLAFQMCVYSAMRAHYEYRGFQGWNDIKYFLKESKYNSQCLNLVQHKFKVVIDLMKEFLESSLS